MRRWGSDVQRLQTRAVMVEAKQAMELEPAVILPPGYYPATELRHGLETMGGDVIWAAEPQYKIEFSAKELAKLGVERRKPYLREVRRHDARAFRRIDRHLTFSPGWTQYSVAALWTSRLECRHRCTTCRAHSIYAV